MAHKLPNNNPNKMKCNIKRPLENRTFYLDLKTYPGEAKLCKNLKLLGAKQESFLTRDVSFVVSNRDSLKNTPSKTFKVPSKLNNWTPLTPITNTTCHSPLFNESSMDYLDSPPNTNSPASDQNAVPMSRGMAMLQKAVLKKQAHFTTDVIEVCKQWNVKILHVDNVLAKVEKLKSHFNVQFAAERKKLETGERKLKPPFLKIEEAKRAWTCYREFPSSTFNNKLSDQVKELYNHFKKSGNIQVAFKPILGEVVKNKCVKTPMANSTYPQSISKSFSKMSETTAKPSTAFSVCNGKRKIIEQPLVTSKKQKTFHGRKKKLYCEICKVNYVNLDKHLASNSHRIFMSDPMNYLEIQNIITSLPKKEDFLIFRSSLCSNSEHTWDMMLGHSSEVGNSFDCPQVDLQGYSISCDLSAHTGSHFNPSLLASITAAPTIREDFDTEQYPLLDEEYISPSCTSPESVCLPYLDDSIDGNPRKSVECGKPLNLSKKGNGDFINQSQSFTQATYLSYSDSSIKNGGDGISVRNAFGEGINILGESAAVLNEYPTNIEVEAVQCDASVVPCQRNMHVEHLNTISVMEDSQYLGEAEPETIFKDGMNQENTTQLTCIPVECSIDTGASVHLGARENESHTHLLLNDDSQITSVESSKSGLLENCGVESLPISKIDIDCNSTIENVAVSATIEIRQNIDTVQLERVNLDCTELSISEQNAVPDDEMIMTNAIQDKVQNNSNDSGIGIQDSPPASLTLCPSFEEDSPTLLNMNGCCALDLSMTKENLPETSIIVKNDQMCVMPELSPNFADTVSLHHPLDVSIECMPILIPVSSGNHECEAVTGDIDIFNNSKNLETHVLHENEYETIKQNTSLPSPAVCPDSCEKPVEESPKCEPSAENSSPNTCITCEPIVTDINSSSEPTRTRKVSFSKLCEEVSKSFNQINDDLGASSSTSCYEIVEEADFDSSSTECEWENIHSNVNSLCQSFCDEEGADTCVLRSTCL